MRMETGKSDEYFSHDCNAADDPKNMLLIAQMGLEAYGIYWVLIEYLRKQPDYKAPMILLDALSRRYGSSLQKFEAVVTKFDLFQVEVDHFCSISLIRRMQPLEDKRNYMRELALKRWSPDKDDASVMRTHSAGNAQAMQSKVKESKVKKSKVKESKEEKEDTSDRTSFHYDANQSLILMWKKWVDFRKALKKPYKTKQGEAAAYNRLITLADSVSETAIAIIQQSMDHEWLDFYALKTMRMEVAVPGEDPIQRDIRLTREARAALLAAETVQKNQSNGN
jgi:hypothetical protein